MHGVHGVARVIWVEIEAAPGVANVPSLSAPPWKKSNCILSTAKNKRHGPEGFFFKILFIYLFIERKGKVGRETSTCERCINRLPLEPPTGDPAHNPGVSPEWESNQQTFSLQAGAQSSQGKVHSFCFMLKL